MTNGLLRQFGRTTSQARERYAQFMHEAQTKSNIWHNLRNQMYLGDGRFVRRCNPAQGQLYTTSWAP